MSHFSHMDLLRFAVKINIHIHTHTVVQAFFKHKSSVYFFYCTRFICHLQGNVPLRTKLSTGWNEVKRNAGNGKHLSGDGGRVSRIQLVCGLF